MAGKATKKIKNFNKLSRKSFIGTKLSSLEDQRDNSTIESNASEESDDEERKLRFIDSKMKLWFIDIVNKMK